MAKSENNEFLCFRRDIIQLILADNVKSINNIGFYSFLDMEDILEERKRLSYKALTPPTCPDIVILCW